MTDWRIIHGDSAEVLQELEDCSVDMVATDVPYQILFMGKAWDKEAPLVDIFTQCLRVLKPGAAFVTTMSTRLDRLWRVCRDLEEVGFDLQQTCMCWIYRQGFTKGKDFEKMADDRAGAERDITGPSPGAAHRKKPDHELVGNFGFHQSNDGTLDQWQSAPAAPLAATLSGQYSRGKVKPAFELIIWARKPISEKTEFDNVVKWGTGAVNCGECMLPYGDEGAWVREYETDRPKYRSTSLNESVTIDSGERAGNSAGRFPANVMVSDNALGDGSRYFDIDAWAAAHGFADEDGWAEAAEAGLLQIPKASASEKSAGCDELPAGPPPQTARSNAAPGRELPLGRPRPNAHPTCKPVRLFAFIIELLSPKEGTVLDPFAGSATTLVAAIQTGRKAIGVEMEAEYVAIAEARCKWAEQNKPAQQAMEL